LKPSLFKNELLAVADPLYTLIFQGLWCLADREGRLEDRPARIHFDINPGRAFDTTEKALNWLEENKFIQRYEADGIKIILVIQFSKHQDPHHKEAPSKLPKPQTNPGQALDKPEASPVVAPLTPSSLTPDSLYLRSNPPGSSVLAEPPEFGEFKSAYPRREGNQPWAKALSAIRARLREGHTWEQLISGARRYAAWCAATEKTNTELVMHAATFCGKGLGFMEPWKAKGGGNGLPSLNG